jgi:hypothetical protein
MNERWESVPADQIRIGDWVRIRYGIQREVLSVTARNEGVVLGFGGWRRCWFRPGELLSRRVV